MAMSREPFRFAISVARSKFMLEKDSLKYTYLVSERASRNILSLF